MTQLRAILLLTAFFVAGSVSAQTQERPEHPIEIMSGDGEIGRRTVTYTNDVVIKSGSVVLMADHVAVDTQTGEAVADGHVRIQQDSETWVGEHIRYNFKTRQMETDQFRTGTPPLFAQGRGLYGDLTNNVYHATNALVTADDFSKPGIKIRAKHIRIVPGKRIEADHAVLYLGEVPVFYFPYYTRNLGERANNLNVTPGYRSRFGPFLLGTYEWFLNEQWDGEIHLDYRQKRGVGLGPDFNYHLGRWGNGTLQYYYTHDDAPGDVVLNSPVYENRQRVYFAYDAHPFTNFNVKALARYQSDIGVVRDFFEGEYRRNPQPNTFVEINRFWQNFSLDVLTQPRVNDFYETVERLPDVRLTGFRQQLGATAVYYESESSAGYYRKRFAETNLAPAGLNFEAARADTYHQLVLPQTLFGWLNVTPRMGGRFTYYSEASGPNAVTDEEYRAVFNTGAEMSFKASRVWPALECKTFEMDGLRHILEPSVNYVFVPRPNDRPNELPQFDHELASLRLLPVEYPQYNAIDAIDSQNVIRFGLRNRLQTKRDGKVGDLLSWEMFTDWRLRPRTNQDTYADLYSDLIFRPRSWLTVQSLTRFDIEDQDWRMSLHTVTFQPNNIWSWSVAHFYLRDDFSGSPTALGQGNNLITSSIYYRLNENWGFRATHHFDVRRSRLQEQYYTFYRDLRSWTAAVSAGLRDNGPGEDEVLVAFTFSLKAMPRFGVGSDTVRPYSLLGR
jgi:LPS-assembly protein